MQYSMKGFLRLLFATVVLVSFGAARAQKFTLNERAVLVAEFERSNARVAIGNMTELAEKVSATIAALKDTAQALNDEQAALVSQALASSFAAADTLLAAWEDLERTAVAPLRKRAIEGYLPLAACRLLSSAARKLRERPLTIVAEKPKKG